MIFFYYYNKINVFLLRIVVDIGCYDNYDVELYVYVFVELELYLYIFIEVLGFEFCVYINCMFCLYKYI